MAPPDLFSSFSWREFALVAFLCSLVPFLSAAKYGNATRGYQLVARIKSSLKRFAAIHAGFLALVVGVLWESAQMYSTLPLWMRAQGSKGLSLFDGVVCAVLIFMIIAEQRWMVGLRPDSATLPGE
jgi:hypothetical protein